MRALLLLLLLLLSTPAHSHEWYSPHCCGDGDCRPVPLPEARTDSGGTLYILINGKWRAIPPAAIQEKPSPDGRLHVCYSRYTAAEPTIYCVYLPASM